MSLLVISEILGLFVNTLTANCKYSLSYREILEQPIQIQLSQKEKTCPVFLAAFLEFTSLFNILKKR